MDEQKRAEFLVVRGWEKSIAASLMLTPVYHAANVGGVGISGLTLLNSGN